MKWERVIIICIMLLSIQIASADTLNLTAGTYETFADNRNVTITANLTNSTGYPVNGTRVNFTTDLGNLSASYNHTNASGIAVVNISSWDIGSANITAEANTINATVNVTFVMGPISRIILSSISEGTVNTTHLITATVYDKTACEFANDENKWRVMPNVTLNFTITPPPDNKWNSPITYNSANITPSTNATDLSGITTAIVRLDKRAGSNGINVSTVNEEGDDVYNYRTIIGIAGAPANLIIDAAPEQVIANNIDTSQVTGKMTDEFQNPLISIGSIRFNTTDDVITKPLDDVGEAAISIGPAIFTGNVTVNGTYLDEAGNSTNLTNETVVVFYAEEPARILVTADATKISTSDIAGVNKSAITASVIDRLGHVLPNRTVNFSTTLGDLSLTTAITDTNGQATATLHSYTAGDATVTASTLNDSGYEIEGSIVIHIMNESFVSVITTIEPDPVEPGGIINVTTTISGQGNITGTRLAAHAMLALDRSGSMDPDYYAGTPLDVVEVLDRSGSMKFLGSSPEQPMTDAKTAAKVFMDNLVSNAQIGVVSFSSSSRIDIGLTLLNSSDNRTLVRDAINGIHADGGTAIGDGLADANNMLIGGRADARKITVLLTDGVCNSGSDQDCSQAITTANANDITIYTIGLGSAEYIDEPLLQRVAAETGGKYYNAPTSSELRSVYNSIAQEISDYDITEIEYGGEGFTLYNYVADGSLTSSVSDPTYTLRFEGYDLDDSFNAGSNYGGSDAGECLIQINGVNFTLIPPPSYGDKDCNPGWMNYEYDITDLVQNGSNTVTFYDYHNYCGGDAWTNRIRHVEILVDGIQIEYYPADVDIKGSGYDCSFTDKLPVVPFTDTFLINETINDLKVLLEWDNSSVDLNMALISPGGHVYGTESAGSAYIKDDYERGSLGSDYSTGGAQNWTITTADYHNGSRSSRSGSISNSQTTWMERTVTLTRNGLVEFWYRTSTEHYRDFFDFYIDGVSELHVAGNVTWMRFQEPLDAGTHTLKWEYAKDGSGSGYDDCVYIDEMRICYGTSGAADTTGYYFDDREAVPIDLRAPEFDTYITSASPDTDFASETSFYVTDNDTGGEVSCPIMRWRLPAAPTENAQIENVVMYLRGITPTYDPDTKDRSINIYDLTTSYDDDPTWNCSDNSTSQAWASGSFSSADNDSYLIDSVALTSSISDDVVEFDITSANWSGNRVPDWGEECNIVLVGEGYDGAGADRFASGEYYRTSGLNNWRPLVTITYSISRDTSEYVWIHPLPYTYPDTDADVVENGNWTVQVTGSGNVTEQFNITTYIDKKSAAKLASHAFISSLDPTREDRVGLATYSYSSTNETANQTSYVCEGNQWEGYFTVNTPGIYYFNLSWDNTSDDLDLYLYDGITILNTSATGSNPETVSTTLSTGTNYRIVVNGTNVTGNDTQFTINVSSSLLREVMCAYYDSNSGSVPRYRQWDGADWSDEASAKDVGGDIDWIVLQPCPTRNETIMGTLDYERDLNIQIWDGSGWSAVQEFSWIANYDHRRAFDIAYEQNSGDAVVVYRNSDTSTSVPRYRVWDGSAWSAEGAVNATTLSNVWIQWVRLVAKPNTDEILLVFRRDNDGDHSNVQTCAQIWNGSAWGNVITLTESAIYDNYQCFDAAYDHDGNAMVVWAQSDKTLRYSRWNGTAWSTPATIYTDTHETRWIKLASDPNSNKILMGALDSADDISVSAWNGSAWTTTNWKIETDAPSYNRRYFDVSFEQTSGIGMVVWSDNTHTPKYITWNASSDTWSSEHSASSTGTSYVSWVQLTPDPDSNEMFLMTSDGNSDINIQKWDGSGWSIPTEVEASSSRYYECFDLTYSEQDTSITQTPVNWLEWRANTDNHLNTSIAGFDPVNSSIDNLTADGMTAIDEGLFEANNALTGYENGTIVLMTDGIDNVGYHSMIAEAERAAANNTTIFTVGFGSEIDDRILRQIANITGGRYYFAPNATVLKSIFVGIAGELGNFTAPEPKMAVYIGNNTTIEGAFTNVTYINNSASVTYFNCTCSDCSEGYYAEEHPSNPNITYTENRTVLTWDVGNRPDYVITVGRYWNVTYQLKIDNNSAGMTPVIVSPSSLSYMGTYGKVTETVTETIPNATVNVQTNATPGTSTLPAEYLELRAKAEDSEPPDRPSPLPNTIKEYACRLTAHLTDKNETPVAWGAVVEFEVSSGTLYNYTDFNTSGILNETTKSSGNAIVWLCSDAPGTVKVWASHRREDGRYCNDSVVVVFHSLAPPPMIPPAPRPRGVIRLE